MVDYRNLPWHHRAPDGRPAEAGMVESGIERPFPHAGLRPGDPPPPGSSRDQWAGRILLAGGASPFRVAAGGVGVPDGVVVSTDDLGSPAILFLELRFSAPDPTGNPTTWTPLTTFRVEVTLLRGLDDQSSASSETYIVDSTGAAGDPVQWLPISYVQARSLTIRLRLLAPAPDSGQSQWCEAVISQVAQPQYGPAARGKTNIFGAGLAICAAVLVDAADPGTLVALQQAWRTGVILHNPPTTVDPDAVPLLIRFGAPVSNDRNVYSFVLVPGQTYEAFPDYWWGSIYARTLAGESGATAPLKVSSLMSIGAGGA